jgi:hypothetical protein
METKMHKLAVLGASALVLALGVANASAQPNRDLAPGNGQTGVYQTTAPEASTAKLHEGRAAATDVQGIDPVIVEKHGVR